MRKVILPVMLILAISIIVEIPCYGDGNPIYGCFNNKKGNLRIVSNPSACKSSETPISWNQIGPQGSPGPQGPDGVPSGFIILGETPIYTSVGALTGEGDQWVSKAQMPAARWAFAAVTVNNRIYVIGGHDSTETPKATTYEYDPAANTWATKANMANARANHAAAVVNNKIYAIGGHNGSTFLGPVEEYDPVTDIWTTKASIPTVRVALAASAVNNKIYAIGGATGTSPHTITFSGLLATNEEYDPTTDTWTAKASIPIARWNFGAVAMNNKIYAMGGQSGPTTFLATNHEYDPETDTWTPKHSMSAAQYNFGAAAVNNKIYVIGGYNGSVLAINQQYDPATDAWATKTSMPTSREALAAAAANGRVYAMGGMFNYRNNEEYYPGFYYYLHKKN